MLQSFRTASSVSAMMTGKFELSFKRRDESNVNAKPLRAQKCASRKDLLRLVRKR